MNNIGKNIAIWVIIGLVLMTVFNQFSKRQETQNQVEYSTFIGDVEAGRVQSVVIEGHPLRGQWLKGRRADGSAFTTYAPYDPQLVNQLIKSNVRFSAKPEEEPSLLMNIFISWFPMLLLIGVWVFFMRQMQGGGKGGAFSFGKSRARMLDQEQNTVTFADVAGCDEAKEEVKEIVDYLRDPSRYQTLGGRIPRGILLAGSPGTGKTLLAKAIAGEAKVPFFSISGSDFVEMFVGVGAARVRDMFEQARKSAPSILFIDEIDAVGRQRGAGHGGGHDEREQTLNSLLVEMDGIEGHEGIIVVAATNRADVLDAALLRPGRFDRHVYVDLPDIHGREEILQVHAKKVKLAAAVDLKHVARITTGCSGAQLANLLNEAALLAARQNKKEIETVDIEQANDKISFGAERRRLMDDEDRKSTAFHEAGHAIVQALLDDAHLKLHKVTIIPRGRALGMAMMKPTKDIISRSKTQYLNYICMCMAGRIGEEIATGDFSSGAVSDIKQATNVARHMVCDWGMSSTLGPVSLNDAPEMPFYGRDIGRLTTYSEETARRVDAEIHRIIDEQYRRAGELIASHADAHRKVAEALLEYETLDALHVHELLEFGEIRTPVEYRPLTKRQRDETAVAEAPADAPAFGAAPATA